MPAKFDRCVKHLRDQGSSLEKAFAICQVSVNKAKVRNPKGKKKLEGKKHEANPEDMKMEKIEKMEKMEKE